MAILVGMDEAGYGPNYGPLVIAATAWQVEEQARDGELGIESEGGDCPDLYRLLSEIVAKSICGGRIAIADSKKLHQPGKGLRRLEHGLHTVLAAMDQPASCWSALVESCAADPDEHHAHLCWHTGFDCQLPFDVPLDEVAQLAAQLRDHAAIAGVQPLAVRARFIFPAQFNELTDQLGGKAAALSHVTIALLREVLDEIQTTNSATQKSNSPNESPAPSPQPQAPTFVVCDKHSGRNFYAGLLQHFFPDQLIAVISEGVAESLYEWQSDSSQVSVAFRAKGETFLPTALASMTAKYLRELSMRAFNEFWCARIPNLRPTAGYPADAHRYREAITPLQRELKIDNHIIWRNR